MSYPVFLDLRDKPVLIAGGGRIAFRKAKSVLKSGAIVRVVAPEISDEFGALEKKYNDRLKVSNRVFHKSDINNVYMVFAATNDSITNDKIAKYCSEACVWVNHCADTMQSSFRNGAVIKQGELEVVVSTGGHRPGVAKWIAKEIQRKLPRDIQKIMEKYDMLRKEAKQLYKRSQDREAFIKSNFEKLIKKHKK